MNERRIVVTGGAGFIGSNIANSLAADNDVVVIDDESLGTREHLVDAVTFHNRSVLEEDLPVDGADLLIHFAARSSYDLVEEDPQDGFRVNVEGFVNTVDQAMETGCDHVVYASSSSIYAHHESPVTESDPVEANTGYEATKLARERAAEYLQSHYGITMAGLRLFSVYQGYGGRESHKGGYANVLAQFAETMAEGEAPVLYGDGTQARDFVHVDDVVQAVKAVAEAGESGVFNVGTGTATSFNDAVDLINDALGTSIEPTYIEHPMPESVYVEYTCGDASRLSERTDWSPTIDLNTGIERVCRPYMSR